MWHDSFLAQGETHLVILRLSFYVFIWALRKIILISLRFCSSFLHTFMKQRKRRQERLKCFKCHLSFLFLSFAVALGLFLRPSSGHSRRENNLGYFKMIYKGQRSETKSKRDFDVFTGCEHLISSTFDFSRKMPFGEITRSWNVC